MFEVPASQLPATLPTLPQSSPGYPTTNPQRRLQPAVAASSGSTTTTSCSSSASQHVPANSPVVFQVTTFSLVRFHSFFIYLCIDLSLTLYRNVLIFLT